MHIGLGTIRDFKHLLAVPPVDTGGYRGTTALTNGKELFSHSAFFIEYLFNAKYNSINLSYNNRQCNCRLDSGTKRVSQ